MKAARIQISLMITAWSFAFAFCCEKAFSQDDPHRNAKGEIQVVYPKRRDVAIRPLPGLLAECKCPKGLHLMWYVVDETGDDYHLVDRACGGVAKKSEVYSAAEVEIFDLNPLKDSEDEIWRKMLFARHLQHDGSYESNAESIKIFVSVLEKNPDELTALFHRSFALAKNQLFDAALLGLNHANKLDQTTYEIPYLIGQVLLYKNLMTPVSNGKYLLEKAYENLSRSLKMTPNRYETILMSSICLRHFGKYDEIKALIKSIDHDQYVYTRDLLYLIRAEAQAKSMVPNYDKSLQDFQFVYEHSEDDRYRLCAAMNISVIHSTRTDVENRNPNLAFDFLQSLEKNVYLSQNTAGFLYANCLAHLTSGEFDRADTYLQGLKNMILSDEEAPDLKSIEEAIKTRSPYLPKIKIPLISAKGIYY